MEFGDAIRAFEVKVKTKHQAVFAGVVAETANSIKFGSELTGAPGQPVDTGALQGSWQTDFESPESAVIGTNLEYAPYIEDGVVPVGSHRGNVTGDTKQRLTLRSAVGGFHSVALTVAGFDKIVEAEAAKVAE